MTITLQEVVEEPRTRVVIRRTAPPDVPPGRAPRTCPPDVPPGRAPRMHQTPVPTAVWQRRTNKIIAAGITVIGLTMMLSLIPQCIYIGIAFVTCALIWLGWMTMKERNMEPPRPESEHPASPVLFLVASHHLHQTSRGPTLPDPEDKPPTYDQIVKLDGLPPDYYSILTEKPPRYEELSPTLGWGACALPAKFYTTEHPCVHTSTVGSTGSIEVVLHGESTSSFLHESPSWSSQSGLSPANNGVQSPSFASDNPSFQLVLEDIDAKESLSLAMSQENDSTQEERIEMEKDDDSKVPTDHSSV
ncbi:uncharacterized protein [Procambarus clarkii]|uniref:uncharacterized protein isoform X2 n=1 Tax=Procambarus clarkii TaxID=6728 RepID=UPI00374283C2